MKTLSEIIHILKSHKAELQARYPIKNIAVFGSVARGNTSAESDIDIMVEFDGKIGSRFIDLAEEIEEILQHKTDLVSRNGIKQQYFEYIKPDLNYV